MSYLVFQLFSHKDLYDDNHPDIFKSTKYQGRLGRRRTPTAPTAELEQNPSLVPLAPITSNGLVTSPPQSPTPRHQDLAEAESAPVSHSECEDEEEETPQMSVGLTVGLLVVVTVVSQASPPAPARSAGTKRVLTVSDLPTDCCGYRRVACRLH